MPGLPASAFTQEVIEGYNLSVRATANETSNSQAKSDLLRAAHAYRTILVLASPNEYHLLNDAYERLGIISVYLARLYKDEENVRHHYERESVQMLNYVYENRPMNNDIVRKHNIERTVLQVFYDELDASHNLEESYVQILHLSDFLSFRLKSIVVEALVLLAERVFQKGVCHRERGSGYEALLWLRHTYRPLYRAELYLSPNHQQLKVDIRVLEKDTNLEISIAKAVQANTDALNDFHKYCLKDIKTYTPQLATVDKFNLAIKLSEGCDLEEEAKACCYIGHIHDKVLELPDIAKAYYMYAMHLAEAAKPKILTRKPWFVLAINFLREYQSLQTLKETQNRLKERQFYLDALKDDIKNINDANSNLRNFVSYLYDNYPPNMQKSEPPSFLPGFEKLIKEDSLSKEELNEFKELVIFIIHDYNPIQNFEDSKAEDDKKNAVFAECVSEILNKHYQELKNFPLS